MAHRSGRLRANLSAATGVDRLHQIALVATAAVNALRCSHVGGAVTAACIWLEWTVRWITKATCCRTCLFSLWPRSPCSWSLFARGEGPQSCPPQEESYWQSLACWGHRSSTDAPPMLVPISERLNKYQTVPLQQDNTLAASFTPLHARPVEAKRSFLL